MRIRTPVVLLLVAGAGYWIYKTHPTVSGFVDVLTSPLMSSKAAVKESEYKRIVAEAVPAAGGRGSSARGVEGRYEDGRCERAARNAGASRVVPGKRA